MADTVEMEKTMDTQDRREYLQREGLLRLLEIKDSDTRILTLEQGWEAVDHGIHIGGAFSAVIPLVALYHGGIIRIDVEQPTRVGQDLFVLSKGHAVASLASLYAELGYFDRSVLKGSRSVESILNGHPGPLLPGVHISTGPEGHGLAVAQGFALAGRWEPAFDVFCLTGDGELQAGLIWEAAMFAGAKRLDSLCLLVDKNEGQLDNPRALQFPMPHVARMLESFGWRVFDVDATQYAPVLSALEEFRYGRRDGRPTAVVCNTRKGHGGLSSFMVGHKVELSEALVRQELEAQRRRRAVRVERFFELLEGAPQPLRQALLERAAGLHLQFEAARREARVVMGPVRTRPAPPREKRVAVEAGSLPKLDPGKEHAANAVLTLAMKAYAAGGQVASVDSDLGSTSGLEPGVGWADQRKALNVGVAEANMSCIGEALAVLGYNTWVSTFCPFFDWRVLRRIAVNYQERAEVLAAQGGWLSAGHNLDLTFLATAANFDTRTNGATHMGNDDALVFAQIAHLKVIDCSCPNQLLGIVGWIMEGDRGLVYLRIMRAASAVLYPEVPRFEYGKGYWVHGGRQAEAVLVSSGRGVHEAFAAAQALEAEGRKVAVVDMPSADERLLRELHDAGKPVVIAEQNNGFLWEAARRALCSRGGAGPLHPERFVAVNTLDAQGRPQFIHSATYEQLLERFGLSPAALADRVRQALC